MRWFSNVFLLRDLLNVALRMAPAHPIGNRRITPPEGAVIGGLQIAGHVYAQILQG